MPGGPYYGLDLTISSWFRFEGYPNNRILYVVDDDEITLYSGLYEIPTRVDEFLHLSSGTSDIFSYF